MSADTFDPRTIPLRFTHLKAMARSGAHFRHAVEKGRPDSAGLRLGRMVHWGVLGCMPDDEDGKVVVYDGERRGNAWKEFQAAHPGDEIVTAAEQEKAAPIIAAVLADPTAEQFLQGDKERRINWELAGRKCTSRVDVINPARGFLTDLKTTTNTRPEDFKRLCWKMNYHAQLAFYDAAAEYNGIALKDHYIVGVETVDPYVVTVLRCDPRVIEAGRRTFRAWFEVMRGYEDSKFWPGYAQCAVPWEVPEWLESSDDDEDEAAA